MHAFYDEIFPFVNKRCHFCVTKFFLAIRQQLFRYLIKEKGEPLSIHLVSKRNIPLVPLHYQVDPPDLRKTYLLNVSFLKPRHTMRQIVATRHRDRLLNKSCRVTCENHCRCDRILSLRSVARIQTGQNKCKQPCRNVSADEVTCCGDVSVASCISAFKF